ncbi:uncharacterized protein B0H18DRAFT_1083610 [Fomitopsis serialis]|uniref:uncharacterized protein n=1 Tax=Fomitopsis serialis TaxID=139415 RepID=UPI002008627F|nr:uncharacterized protein B0H18DRAFT_1083610 [Neoantrodia serialis]KAH9930824.1 hypothetical protein B0H18DRAFT_1083610 [Neoantrodia serialis]
MDATDSGTPFGPLLLTVHDAIFEVVLVCSAGYILARKGILDKPTQGRAFATAAGMFMNSNTLPIALMQSLVITVRWSYGVRLLSKADPEVAGETSSEPVHKPVAEPVETDRLLPQTMCPCNVDEPNASPRDEESDDDVGNLPLARRLHTEPTSSIWQSRRRRLDNRLRELWKVFCERMKLPFWAALAALVVACISPLQRTLAHIECIRGALDMAGDCSPPLTLVVQGAYFYTPATVAVTDTRACLFASQRQRASRAQIQRALPGPGPLGISFDKDLRGRRRSRGETGNGERRPGGSKIVSSAVLSRWILAPAATKENWQPVFEELPRMDAFERLLSRTVFWSYCVVTPSSMIAVVVVGLLLTKL